LGTKDRRISDIGFGIFPVTTGEAALGTFENRLIGHPGIPVNRTVHGNHVGQRGTGGSCPKGVGLGDKKGCLISAPGMTLKSDSFPIDHSRSNSCFDGRQNAPDC